MAKLSFIWHDARGNTRYSFGYPNHPDRLGMGSGFVADAVEALATATFDFFIDYGTKSETVTVPKSEFSDTGFQYHECRQRSPKSRSPTLHQEIGRIASRSLYNVTSCPISDWSLRLPLSWR
jgi:hypothetical protein